jgi:DNA-binding MarR family transcriptional regulator
MVRVLHLATVGEDTDPIMVGVREYPVAKLLLLHTKETERFANDVQRKLAVLKLPVQLVAIGKNVLLDTLRTVTRVLQEERPKYDDVIINVSSGDKMISCAALSAAFVNGVRAIGVENDACFALPVLKFSYSELISEPKIRILKALEGHGGEADSLHDLSEASGVEKSLLSYHVRGGRDTKGLEQLGLIEVDRAQQGRLVLRLTPMGRLMLVGN